VIQLRSARRLPGLVFASALIASVLGFGLFYDRAAQTQAAAAMDALDRDLAREVWSDEVRRIAAWAIRTNDHRSLPFVVIDQAHARLFAFDDQGRLAGSTPILRNPVDLEEAAPAGRFVADTRRSSRVDAIVWANEHDVLSLDDTPPAPHRDEPVAAGFHHHGAGSIHVPGDFFRRHLHAFRHQASVAYVLPGELGMHRHFRVYAAGRYAPESTRSYS
jgi:hypothetical protein